VRASAQPWALFDLIAYTVLVRDASLVLLDVRGARTWGSKIASTVVPRREVLGEPLGWAKLARIVGEQEPIRESRG